MGAARAAARTCRVFVDVSDWLWRGFSRVDNGRPVGSLGSSTSARDSGSASARV
jgi:hypothetical protein